MDLMSLLRLSWGNISHSSQRTNHPKFCVGFVNCKCFVLAGPTHVRLGLGKSYKQANLNFNVSLDRQGSIWMNTRPVRLLTVIPPHTVSEPPLSGTLEDKQQGRKSSFLLLNTGSTIITKKSKLDKQRVARKEKKFGDRGG